MSEVKVCDFCGKSEGMAYKMFASYHSCSSCFAAMRAMRATKTPPRRWWQLW